MRQELQDLTIVGGGIMGLFTAYYASSFSNKITILEKSVAGERNKEAASFSLTRSIRSDYLDPFYARLAYEARTLWLDLQSEEPFIIDCGCLNIAKEGITPRLDEPDSAQRYDTLTSLHFRAQAYPPEAPRDAFPQFVSRMCPR